MAQGSILVEQCDPALLSKKIFAGDSLICPRAESEDKGGMRRKIVYFSRFEGRRRD
jgi:hypothetical protein